MNFFARLAADRRLLGWCLFCLLSLPPALGYWGVRIAGPVAQGWVSPEVLQELEDAQRTFRFNAPLVMVLESENFFTVERIAALHGAVDALRQMPEVHHLTWIGDLREVTLRGDETPVLPPPDVAMTPEELDTVAQTLRQHPLAVNSLISEDGKTLLLLIDARERSHVEPITQKAQGLLSPLQIQVRPTGSLALYDLHDRALEGDHLRIQVMANLLVIVLAVIIFRRPSAILIASSGSTVGVIWTLGWLRLIGQSENELAKIILPVMVMMIGFTDGVHMVVRIRQLRAVGSSVRDSVFTAVHHIGPACFLTSLTTAIGFGSLMISESEMIAGFGRVSAIGVVVTFFAVILTIPLLSNSPVGRQMHVHAAQDPITRLMNHCDWIAVFASRYAKGVTLFGIVLTAACGYFATHMVPDDRISDRIPHESDEWRAMRHADEEMGGIRYLQLVISWPEDFTREQVWEIIRRCERILKSEPAVGPTTSIRTVLTVFRGPDRRDNSVLVNRLPEELRGQFYRPEIRRTQVVARLQDLGIAVLDPVFASIQQQVEKVEQAFPGITIEQVSDQAIEGRIVRTMIEELMKSLLMASLIIFCVLALAFRSIRLGLISIIPNLMPLAITGALRLLIDESLGIASACSFAICLGIAVDDTIHYLIQFRSERRQGYSPVEANRRAFVSVGSAMLMTTLVMVGGLGTVMTSQMPPHVNFAAMACTTLAAALLADLVFLPALLSLFPGKEFPARTITETDTTETEITKS